MELFWLIFWLVIGLIIMIKSADYFVDSAVVIAEISGIPKMIVGATIVSLATTLPEFFTSLSAILEGSAEAPDAAVGNALGSVIFNTSVILSVAAIFMSGKADRKNIIEKASLLAIALGTLYIFSLDNQVTILEGAIQLSFVALYTFLNIRAAKKQKEINSNSELRNKTKILMFRFIVLLITAGLIYLGSQLLVRNAFEIATRANVPYRVIAITILAIGTSLPELTTTITSIIKKQQSLSVGNVLGANILNITMVLGTVGIIAPQGLTVGNDTLFIDMPIIAFIIALFVIPIIIKGKLSKWQGIVGLSTYFIYITYILMNI